MDPFELYAIDGLLTDEERAIRDTVRDFGAKELRPHVATWFDDIEPGRQHWSFAQSILEKSIFLE